MPESRDRLSRPADIASLFSRRRLGLVGGVYQDPPDLVSSPLPATPSSTATTATGRGRGSFGTPRRYNTYGRGRENAFRRGNGRGGRRVLPSWYPRTPLRDITSIVRAIERRRERLGESRVREIESPEPLALEVPDSSSSALPGAHLEHSNISATPIPSTKLECCPPPSVGKVPKILLGVATRASDDDSEFLTPQKKLLNSIDTVQKEVMEELQKLKRTATAKKAERERKVRVLQSFRGKHIQQSVAVQ